jgi:hypothetical protein
MSSFAAQKIRTSSKFRHLTFGVAIASAAIATVAVAAGPAQAASSPSVVGQKYSDAKGALSTAGYTVIVSNTFGDQTNRDDCIVVRQQDRSVPPPENTGASATNETLVALNCDAAVASATKAGNSLGSPEGRAAAAAAASSSASAAAATPAAAG